MATDTEKPTAVEDVKNQNGTASAEENPKTTAAAATEPPSAPSSIDANANTVEVKEGDDSKKKVAAVTPSTGEVAPSSDIEKKIRRAERFGVSVQLSEVEKRNSRAERFGMTSATQGSEVSKTSEELKRKARAERFGLTVPSSASDEEAKKKARLARFAPDSKTNPVEEEKRKARAIRFSESSSASLSQANGKRNIETQEAAIAGEAGGTT